MALNLKNGLSYRAVHLGQNYTQSITYTVIISGRYNENGAQYRPFTNAKNTDRIYMFLQGGGCIKNRIKAMILYKYALE